MWTWKIIHLLRAISLAMMMLGVGALPLVAQTNYIFIDPVDSQVIWRVKTPFQEETLLSVGQLPKQHPEHEAVYFAEQKFSYMALAPDQERLAFTVDAIAHDWVGILNLKNGQRQDLDFFLEGRSLMTFWSKDGRFLVVEGELPDHKFVEVVDTQEGTNCRMEGKGLQRKFLNFSHAWFSQEDESLFFRVDYNNDYRKKLGLKAKSIPPRIGQTNLQCQNFEMYSVKQFVKKFPEQMNKEQVHTIGFNTETKNTIAAPEEKLP